MRLTQLALATALLLAPVAALAQVPDASNHDLQQRKHNQQQRIGNGVRSGQLTPRETAHLEHQERGINREERGMRAQDNGHLTRGDRRTLRSQQNAESRRIYRDKHNAAVR